MSRVLAWQEALEALPLPLPRIELPELSVRLEGDCGFYKDYDICIPISMLVTAIRNTNVEKKKQARSKIYLPQKGDRGYYLLLLLLLAEAYPYPISIASIKQRLHDYGLDTKRVKKILCRYYHYYQVIERVGYGIYRMKDEYYELLNHALPDWRIRLQCIRKSLSKYGKDHCEEILSRIKESLIYLINNIKSIRRSQKVPKSPKESQSITLSVINWDSDNGLESKIKGKQCFINTNKILDVIKRHKPALYEGLYNDRMIASELIAILYKRAKEGRAYIVATDRESLHTAIVDEAHEIFGSSSSLWQTLDWEQIKDVAMLLRSSGIIFSGKYGRDFKMRLDKRFIQILDDEGVMECET